MTRKLTLYSILLAALCGKAREGTLTAIIKVKIQNLAQEFFTFQSQYSSGFRALVSASREALKLKRKYRLAKGGEDL